MTKRYFLKENNQCTGPFTSAQLEKRYRAAEIDGDTFCRPDKLFSIGWKPLQTLFPHFYSPKFAREFARLQEAKRQKAKQERQDRDLKTDHFPMLIPQPALFTGRRRPDFLVFVPITRFQYRFVIVLIDRPGKSDDTVQTETDDYTRHGYVVKRLAVGGQESHFKLARDLKNWIEVGASA